ncbi:MAG TPA: aldo/keto reductase [Vicinamibacterales bacterium]|nr:aldo/keto reductase [Vicinamibacterales bacterium]HPK70781.1 aldo/keto reductase [Vicinamibacterales bacterium]
MDRREFITRSSAASLLACFPASLAGIERTFEAGKLERRALGRTGERLSLIGFGGIVVKDATTAEAAARVAEAIDHGVNYFDVAPTYGNAQDMLGPALEPYRKGVFLACKTTERGRAGSQRELDESLRKLRTDRFDLYQLHAVNTREDVERVFMADGALETLVAARKAGKVRFLGFSAHTVEAALALIARFDFDTILFPINFATWHAGSFGPQVLAAAQAKQMGILALKAMAKGPWPAGAERDQHPKCWYEPLSDPADAMMGLRFTLSHPVTAAVPPGDERLFKMALGLGLRFTPLAAQDAAAIKERGQKTAPLFTHPNWT